MTYGPVLYIGLVGQPHQRTGRALAGLQQSLGVRVQVHVVHRAVAVAHQREPGALRYAGVYGQINVYGVTTKSERYKRSYWTRTAAGNGIGGRKAPVPYGS